MQNSAGDNSGGSVMQIQLAQATSMTGCKAGRLCKSGSPEAYRPAWRWLGVASNQAALPAAGSAAAAP